MHYSSNGMKTLNGLILSLLVIGTLCPVLNSSAQRRQMGGVGITVFTDLNFNGRSATYHEDVPDLQPLVLDDRISSLPVGRGERWEACEHANYKGRCIVVSGNEPDLRRKSWNNLISSMRRLNDGPLPAPGPLSGNDHIVIFERPNYGGRPTNYSGPNPSIPNNGQSVTIGSGVWELCEGRNFSGRCITLDRSVPDLGTYNMRYRVFSVRPAGSRGSIPPPSPGDWYIVLYDRTFYRGKAGNYPGSEADGSRPVRSVRIPSGTWQLCEGRNFTGHCVTLNRSVPDLRVYNIRRVASVRVVTRQPG